VIWDIDGTLVDSEPLHLRALLAICTQYGIDISDLPDDEFVGVNLLEVWEVLKNRFPTSLSREKWIVELNQFYCANSDTLVPMPAARNVVRRLSSINIMQAAVSNSHRLIVDANLEALKLNDYMLFSLSLDDVPIGKPSPVPYQIAISKLGLGLQEIIAIEDSPSGIQSASDAGLVVFGFQHEDTSLITADHIIHSLSEVYDYLH